MENLKEFDFERKVTEMVSDFQGYKDTEAICNINLNGRTVQVIIVLVDEDESDFSDYSGIPTVVLPELELIS